ncbi:hypothetical protein COOONC_17805 [Cooperia oncophora]
MESSCRHQVPAKHVRLALTALEASISRTTTESVGATRREQCNTPLCKAGQFLVKETKHCQFCPRGTFQDEEQHTTCKMCPTITLQPLRARRQNRNATPRTNVLPVRITARGMLTA